jgi:hypothetical protein
LSVDYPVEVEWTRPTLEAISTLPEQAATLHECRGALSRGIRKLLHAFERLLPLKNPSALAQLAATGGLTGAISRLLLRAAELAIHDRC